MLTIVPAGEERRQQLSQRFACHGVQGMIARAGEEELGAGVYILEGETLRLLELAAQDSLLLDGLLRAVLNAGQRAGAKRAVCSVASLAAFLQEEGFFPGPDGYGVELSAFFARPCRGG